MVQDAAQRVHEAHRRELQRMLEMQLQLENALKAAEKRSESLASAAMQQVPTLPQEVLLSRARFLSCRSQIEAMKTGKTVKISLKPQRGFLGHTAGDQTGFILAS